MPKTKYHCEVCDVGYATEKEAIECEERHEAESVVIDGKRLAKAISQVYPCLSRHAVGNGALEHILFEIKNDLLTLVAADGFMLGISSLEVSLPAGEGLMHYPEVKEFQKKLRQAEEVKLRVRNGLVFLIKRNGGEEKITLDMEGLIFPDWRKLFPVSLAKPKTIVTFQAKAMKEALREVKQEWNAAAKLYIEGECIKIVTEYIDGQEKKERKEKSIPARIKGEVAKQAFDWQNLRKMVKALSGEITLKTDGYSQVALFEQGRASWLMMPMYANL